MKPTFVLSFLALASSVVALVFSVQGRQTRSNEVHSASVSPAQLNGKQIEDLQEALDALRARIDRLEWPAAESISSRELPREALVTLEDLASLREELLSSVEGRLEAQTLGGPDSPQLKEQLAGTLQEIRKEEAVAKVKAYQEEREERFEQDMATLSQKLELDSYQADEMRTALLTQYEREDEVRRLWEEGEDDEVLGERKRADGEAFDADLARFLSEEQRETFWRTVAGRK